MKKIREFHISISTQPFELWCFCHIRPFEISWNLRNTPGWDCSDGKSSVVHYKGNDDSLMILINWPNLYFRSSLHLLLFPFSLPLSFSITDDRKNSNGQQMEFKSNQWFGATVRSSGDHILVSLSVEGVKVALKKRLYRAQKGKNCCNGSHFCFMGCKNNLFAKQFYMHQKSQIKRQYVKLELCSLYCKKLLPLLFWRSLILISVDLTLKK